MESAAVQVHSQVAKAANAMDRAQIRIMLIAGIAAGTRDDGKVCSIDYSAGVHEAAVHAARPASYAAGGKPVEAIDAVVEKEPPALVAGTAVEARLPHALAPVEQVLGVGHQVAEHPVHAVRLVVDDEKLALSTRPRCELGETQSIGIRVVVQYAGSMRGGVVVDTASSENANPAADLYRVWFQRN